jgi:hypothetical protein
MGDCAVCGAENGHYAVCGAENRHLKPLWRGLE